jgi:ankyrin repeat protein
MAGRKARLLGAAAAAIMASGWGATALAQTQNEQLIAAVRTANVSAVQAALETRADPNVRLPDNSPVLSLAVDRQNVEVVRLLLDKKADPNAVGQGGIAPLVLACQFLDEAIAEMLVAAGADVNARRSDGSTALALCAENVGVDLLGRMAGKAITIDTPNSAGQTALMYAAAAGKTENVALLLKLGADPNRKSVKGFTPLFFAIQAHDLAAVDRLLAAGADVKYKNVDTTALHIAMFENEPAIVRRIVEAGGDLNDWNREGAQPLHVAIQNGDVELVRYFLSKGANLSAPTLQAYWVDKDGEGGEPVNLPTLASADDRPIKIVVRGAQGAGTPPAAPPTMTPVLLAASKGSVEMMKLLAEAGADAKGKASDGGNVVFVALRSGDLATVKYAFQLTPDPKAVNAAGDSLMHAAVGGGGRGAPPPLEIVQFLADSGVALDAKNERGQKPVDLLGRSPEPMKKLYADLLRARGLDPTIPAGGRGPPA